MKQKHTAKVVTKASPKKEVKTTIQKPGILDNFLSRYPLHVAMGLVSLLILIIFSNFISGNVYYLFKDIGSDTLNTFFPHFVYVNHYLRTEGIPLWSFAQGIGQNIQSISINDPFYFLVYFVDKDTIPYAIVWMEIVKILITSFLIFHVLKMWKLKPLVVIIGTILFSFSSFMIVGGGWYIFSTEICFFALMLLGFEMLWQKNSWFIFPLSVALISANQPFNLFLYGLFLILYMLFRFFTSDTQTFRGFINIVLKLAGFTLLGILISSFFFWSSIQILLDSPRVSGSVGLFNKLIAGPVFGLGDWHHTMTAILRFFSSDMLGHGTDFRGWNNYLEAPLFYVGLLPLLLFPQVFIKAGRKKTIVFAIALFFMIFPVVFPFFRHAWWLYTGDYFRGFSFFVGLTFLLLSLLALNEITGTGKINLIMLAGTLLFLIVLLYYPYQHAKEIVNDEVRLAVLNFLIFYTIISALSFWEGFKPYFGPAILLLIFFEVAYFNYSNLNARSVVSSREIREKGGYNDYSIESAKFVNSIDRQFFRVTKNFFSGPSIHTSYNDAKAQDYYSTPVYGSFNQKYYVKFLEDIGAIKKGNEQESRWILGLLNRPLVQNLVATKYAFAKGDFKNYIPFGFDSINRFGDVNVLKNKMFIPLGFTYDRYITYDNFMKVSNPKKDFILQRAFVAEQPIPMEISKLKTFPMNDTVINYVFTDFYADVQKLRQDTLTITQFSQNHIRGKIELDSAKMLFLSIPYDKGWHAMINGKEVQPQICNIGFLGFFLEPGKYELELTFTPPYYHLSLLLTIAGVIIYAGLLGLHKFVTAKKRMNVAD